MNYIATDFIYDGVPSEKFGLFLCNLDETGSQEYDSCGNVDVHLVKTARMTRNYLAGVSYTDEYSFEFIIGSRSPLDKFDQDIILKWLVGANSFKNLQIIQGDMDSVGFNCIFTEPQIVAYGNLPYAIKLTALCDRPYALTKINTYKYSNLSQQITHINNSLHNVVTLPVLSFICNKANGNVSIKNKSNDNWTSEFIGLQLNEKITIDNQLQTITSSLGRKVLSTFNKHWFELVPKINLIEVTGDTSAIEIKYADAKFIG